MTPERRPGRLAPPWPPPTGPSMGRIPRRWSPTGAKRS